MMVETYLRRGQRSLERMALNPKVRSSVMVAVLTGSGFLLSAVGLGSRPQPVAMGLICSAVGWKALLMMLGAMLGYPTFWGSAGNQGIVWAAAGGLLAIMVGSRQESREQPLMIPCIAAFLALVTGLGFHFILREESNQVHSQVLEMSHYFLFGLFQANQLKASILYTYLMANNTKHIL